MIQIKIEKNDDGFLATCNSLDGAFAEGSSEFEALFNLFDVMRMIHEYKAERSVSSSGKPICFEIPIQLA